MILSAFLSCETQTIEVEKSAGMANNDGEKYVFGSDEDSKIAIDLVFHKGLNHETYNIGGFNEWKNIDLVKLLCKKMDEKLGRNQNTSIKLIQFVKDRPGHDKRYAIDTTKIEKDLNWYPVETFDSGIRKTINWYIENRELLLKDNNSDNVLRRRGLIKNE